MKSILNLCAAIILYGWSSVAMAVPITATYDVDFSDCVILNNGSLETAVDDCTGTVTVVTDTDITFVTPDAGQTGSAVLTISSPSFGISSGTFYNFVEDVIFDTNGNEVPVCLNICFFSDYDPVAGLSFSWGAGPGVPYSYGNFTNGSGNFDYLNDLYLPNGNIFELFATGQIQPSSVPLPASIVMLALGLSGLRQIRRVNI